MQITKTVKCFHCEEDFEANVMDAQTCNEAGKHVYAKTCNPCLEWLSDDQGFEGDES